MSTVIIIGGGAHNAIHRMTVHRDSLSVEYRDRYDTILHELIELVDEALGPEQCGG